MRNVVAVLAVGLFACAAYGQGGDVADGGIVWDMTALGRMDFTNKAYVIDEGTVTVPIGDEKAMCPSGLGHLASGMDPVERIVVKYVVEKAGDYWLHVTWNGGGSGTEQFAVMVNGEETAVSRVIVAEEAPNLDVTDAFKVTQLAGANELVLEFVTGNGMNFKHLVLSGSSDAPPMPESPHALKPGIKYPTLASYSKGIGEEGIMLDTVHVRLYAPKRAEKEARIVMGYLVRAYDALYDIVGEHTKYKMVVWHFPKGHPDGWGGTSVCTIEYSYENLKLVNQAEWKMHKVPHMSGYIEEMTHNFRDVTKAQFGWEAVGWSLGAKVTTLVANNPTWEKTLRAKRREQDRTYRRYKRAGHVYPRDLEANTVDRIHNHLLHLCEKEYGGDFWRDFFVEVRKEKARLLNPAGAKGGDERRNARYAITVDCFERLEGLEFKKLLDENGISTTVATKTLANKPNWNRRLK